jgi:hypothetical protein
LNCSFPYHLKLFIYWFLGACFSGFSSSLFTACSCKTSSPLCDLQSLVYLLPISLRERAWNNHVVFHLASHFEECSLSFMFWGFPIGPSWGMLTNCCYEMWWVVLWELHGAFLILFLAGLNLPTMGKAISQWAHFLIMPLFCCSILDAYHECYILKPSLPSALWNPFKW